MSDLRVFAPNAYATPSVGSFIAGAGMRDGSFLAMPWYQALVFQQKVFGVNIGSVTTPIAGHTAVDADQPEAAIRVPDGTAAIPLLLSMTLETGSTTLGVGGMMAAVSNIDVGNGTSTAETPMNMSMVNGIAVASTARSAYTGNGTDPLTAGNFQELGRQSFILDSDAATSGFAVTRLLISAMSQIMPVVMDAGSILLYAEHANNAPSVYGTILWAEFTESAVT